MSQAGFCIGSIILVSYSSYVLLRHPVEGLGSGELRDVKTRFCVAEGKRQCSNPAEPQHTCLDWLLGTLRVEMSEGLMSGEEVSGRGRMLRPK